MTLSAAPGTAAPAGVLQPTASASSAAMWSSRILSRYHYRPVALDAALSGSILTRYFEELDPEHLLFTQADVQAWLAQRPTLDTQLPVGDLNAPFAIYKLYLQRLDARMAYQQAELKTPMDFTRDESFQPDRDKASWPETHHVSQRMNARIAAQSRITTTRSAMSTFVHSPSITEALNAV